MGLSEPAQQLGFTQVRTRRVSFVHRVDTWSTAARSTSRGIRSLTMRVRGEFTKHGGDFNEIEWAAIGV